LEQIPQQYSIMLLLAARAKLLNYYTKFNKKRKGNKYSFLNKKNEILKIKD